MKVQLRDCDSCGKEYEYRRSTSKYCGKTCQLAGGRGHLAKPLFPTGHELETSTLAELKAAGRSDTAAGQAALIMARRVDSQQDTAQGIAAVLKQWHATMATATANVIVEDDPVADLRDELATRRRRA